MEVRPKTSLSRRSRAHRTGRTYLERDGIQGHAHIQKVGYDIKSNLTHASAPKAQQLIRFHNLLQGKGAVGLTINFLKETGRPRTIRAFPEPLDLKASVLLA